MSDRMTRAQFMDDLNYLTGFGPGSDMEIVEEDQNGNMYPIQEVYVDPDRGRYVIGGRIDED